MHRLLTRKGYIFPEVSATEAAVLNPSDTLKSAAELEKEERDAQEAKLQELVRRGTPADLQEANRLMKIMAGYQAENRTNYRAKVAEEIDKVRRKAEILDEMLANSNNGEDLPDNDDDIFADIVSSLKTAHPKIKSLVEEEKDDAEAVQKLLSLNDYILSLLQKYHYLKSGEKDKGNSIQIARPSSISAPTKAPTSKGLSLIDLDNDEDTSTSTPPATTSGNLDLLSELGGLSLNSNNTSKPASAVSSPPDSKAAILGLFQQSPPAPASATLNNDLSLFSDVSQNGVANSSTPSLTSSTFGNSTGPISLQSSSSPNLFDSFSSFSNTSTTSKPAATTEPADSEWNFASPQQAAPAPVATPQLLPFSLIDDGTIGIAGTVSREPNTAQFPTKASDGTIVHVVLYFSNKSPATPLSNIDIQLAVTKHHTIHVGALSSTALPPMTTNGIVQHTHIGNSVETATGPIKMKWRVSYNGKTMDGMVVLPVV